MIPSVLLGSNLVSFLLMGYMGSTLLFSLCLVPQWMMVCGPILWTCIFTVLGRICPLPLTSMTRGLSSVDTC